MSNHLDYIERLASGDPDPEILAWIGAGLKRWQRGEPLEAALGLTCAHRVRCRNRSLIAAAAALADGESISAWELAGRLNDAIARFESGRLIQYRRGLQVELDDVERYLLDAIQSGARPMTSRRRLFELLRED